MQQKAIQKLEGYLTIYLTVFLYTMMQPVEGVCQSQKALQGRNSPITDPIGYFGDLKEEISWIMVS